MVERTRLLIHEGKGGLVMVEGDAGLGKTRLMEEFKGSIMDRLSSSECWPKLLIFSSKGDAASVGQVDHRNTQIYIR